MSEYYNRGDETEEHVVDGNAPITLRLYFKYRTDKATLYSTQQIGHEDAVDVWIPRSLTEIVRQEAPATPFVLAKHIVEIPAWFYLKEQALFSATQV